MPQGQPFLERVKGWMDSFWNAKNPRLAVLRDVVVAALVVGVLLAGVWIYAGQPLSQAPVVSVESGSMMHGVFSRADTMSSAGWENPPFGRIGTIDPGDIVFVKAVGSPEDIEVAFGPGSRSGYGGHGDVIVFKPNGRGDQTRVIHRAMLYLEAIPDGCRPNVDCVYRIPAFCNPEHTQWSDGQDLSKYCHGSEDPLNFRLHRDGLFLDLRTPGGGYSPPFPCPTTHTNCASVFSGFFTKGDNNQAADQAGSGISGLVRMDWIIGKARGEVPWFGLIKLAIYGNRAYSGDIATGGSDWKILAARAPSDIWICLFLTLGVLIAIPMVIDFVSGRRKRDDGDDNGGGPPPG